MIMAMEIVNWITTSILRSQLDLAPEETVPFNTLTGLKAARTKEG